MYGLASVICVAEQFAHHFLVLLETLSSMPCMAASVIANSFSGAARVRQAAEEQTVTKWLCPPDDAPYGIDFYEIGRDSALDAQTSGVLLVDPKLILRTKSGDFLELVRHLSFYGSMRCLVQARPSLPHL